MPKKINITPEEFQEKHAKNLKAALPDVRKGIEKVTESPMEKAAAKQDKMLAKVTESVQSGKWAARLRATPMQTWKDNFLHKGVDRIPAGIDAAKQKVVEFAGQLLQHEAGLQNEISRISDLTVDDSRRRMNAWMDGMLKFKRR